MRIARRALLFFTLATVLACAACAAPATSDQAATPTPQRQAPPMSRPLPAQRVREAPELASSCRTDADCTVKNVGNCCGAMPACVNVDSPADPAAVQAQCARDGRMSACGFREITACTCTAGRCESADDAMPVERMRRSMDDAVPEPSS